MKRLFFILPVLFFIKASAQLPYYDFKKYSEKTQPLDKVMGKITWSDPNSTFVFPLDKSMSIDSLQKMMEIMQKLGGKQHMGTLVFTQPNATRVYALPQDNMPCLAPDMSQFNMPVIGKGTRVTGMPPDFLPPTEIIPKK
ncbi:MAG TPA: hypothetical protein VK492_03460 [Chitinophagaceae bacterium]|nr:hypothetical protein [Chitinophagaceae bacterium]